MSVINTPVGTFTVEHEVPYLQYVIYPVDENGETDYSDEIHEFDSELASNVSGFWNIDFKDQIIECIPDSEGYPNVVEYIQYLSGWFETHPDDVVTFEDYKSSLNH